MGAPRGRGTTSADSLTEPALRTDRAGAEDRTVPGRDPLPCAPLTLRIAAWLIDASLGVVVCAVLARLIGGSAMVRTLVHLVTFKSINGREGHQLSSALTPGPHQLDALRGLSGLLLVLLVISVGSVAYRVVTTAQWGAGIGKYLLGLRIAVRTPAGLALERPGWKRAWRRWAVPQAPGLIPFPGTGLLAYVPAFRDPLRRGLHDRAAGTVVVELVKPSGQRR
jgi:hypothetical protein